MDDRAVVLNYLTCQRCEHTWIPRKSIVGVCPKCHSPYWNIPKQEQHKVIPLTGIYQRLEKVAQQPGDIIKIEEAKC